MLLNILVDFLFSFIPIVGGFLHLLYKANVYNYEGLRDWLDDPKHPATRATTEASSTKYHPGTITWTQLGKDTASYVYSKKDIVMPSKLKHS
jgi:hypothetical protein